LGGTKVTPRRLNDEWTEEKFHGRSVFLLWNVESPGSTHEGTSSTGAHYFSADNLITSTDEMEESMPVTVR
jgi:hypothetical protein